MNSDKFGQKSNNACFLEKSWKHFLVKKLWSNNLNYLAKQWPNNTIFCPKFLKPTDLLSLVTPKFAPLERMTFIPSLDTFLWARLWLLFEKLHATGNWITKVYKWAQNNKYKITKFLKDLKVVNNLAERCIKDIEVYLHWAKYSTNRENILFVVSNCCKVFKDLWK